MSDAPSRRRTRPGRRPLDAADAPQPVSHERRQVSRSGPAPDDRFCRYLVSSMRNGVIAFRRDGTVALMNDEAYRIFGLTKSPGGDLGRPFAEVLRDWPPVIRVLSSAFELSHLPSRAELRLKDLKRV